MINGERQLLLVDDDPDVVWCVGRYLVRHGFAVTTCGDGAEAVALLESTSFDILVTDVQMPRLNGLALIEWARQHRPSLRVVVITAYGSPSVRRVSLSKGAVLYLEKPVDPDLMIEALRCAEPAEGITGNVNDIDLLDYIQLMILARRDVLLEVRSQNDQRGEIYINSGDVVHAACVGLEGEQAFYRCMGFDGGTFVTHAWREPDRVTIEHRGELLLMESARLRDEDARAASGEPDVFADQPIHEDHPVTKRGNSR